MMFDVADSVFGWRHQCKGVLIVRERGSDRLIYFCTLGATKVDVTMDHGFSSTRALT